MDETHLVSALRYVALNPVRARLVERAEDWRWSSTAAHIAGRDDHVVKVAPAIERVGGFAAFLGEPFDEAMAYAALRKAESAGRPAGVARGYGGHDRAHPRSRKAWAEAEGAVVKGLLHVSP